MAVYNVKLLRREHIAEGTTAFYFEKPAGFIFKPGQFAEWKLLYPRYSDTEGNLRPLSIASAPHEPELMIATRMRPTAFKNSLKEMPLGTEIAVEGPFGSFILHENVKRPAVMVTGGIGVTPFRSMIQHAITTKLPHQIFMFYANRRPEDAAFLDELEDVELKTRGFKLIATMTKAEKSGAPWDGEQGYVTKEMIKKYIDNLELPIYYIAGSPASVAGTWQMLIAAGVSADDIRSEDFAGY